METAVTSKKTRDTAAVEICGSPFFFYHGKCKVLIFYMLAVHIKIISKCGFDCY